MNSVESAAPACETIGRIGDKHRPPPPDLSYLLRQFPPRPTPTTWETTELSRDQVVARLLQPPFTSGERRAVINARHRLRIVDWLGTFPGDTWQERWKAGRCEKEADWRRLLLPSQGTNADPEASTRFDSHYTRGLKLLICGDVIRPSIEWLLVTPSPVNLATEMASKRDPEGFAALDVVCADTRVHPRTRSRALARIAMIMAAKGGLVSAITVGDCVEMQQAAVAARRRLGLRTAFQSPFFYQLLRSLGRFPEAAPTTTRAFYALGQKSVEELIDRYGIECRPIRDLLVDYLKELQVSSDYGSLDNLSRILGKLFWRDLELHHPGIDSLRLLPATASAWKQRMQTKPVRTTAAGGQVIETQTKRINTHKVLGSVRAFYLDIAQWAAEDPGRWGPWAVACPIREGELGLAHKKEETQRKSRMDQRTRERLPVLPALLSTVRTDREVATHRLEAARAASPGETITVAGSTLQRPIGKRGSLAKVWAADPVTGKRFDMEYEEDAAFWAWAAVEVLHHTGIRIEELTELSHHSLIQYRIPTTKELIPLLQIAPSKTDEERLLVISPELADVLSAIITRIRKPDGSVPLVAAYDHHEKIWNPPMPLLFQRKAVLEDRPVGRGNIRRYLRNALANTGLTDTTGAPLHFTPHDFRRLFLTDAIMHGMPPHIAQLVAGHRDINTTMGYKAVYPEEVISDHRAFIARRRALRPSEEYRTPTGEEWQEFLGHFERRRVALGECGRSYSTPCVHEHSCLRCPLLRPDPAQRPRIIQIQDNLQDRIAEAEREGWAGEVEGLKVSLAGARQKLAQLDEMTRRSNTVHLGLPTFREIAGRTATLPPRNP